ncbi:MAG: hypothetical protein JNL71_11760 [Rhodospirillales bacterium]|nr:hypothetical protein [Rhodospirillales bacterium]
MDELDRIRWAAARSIGRGCLFALLAVGMIVFGLIPWPILAFRSGAILTALLAAVLLLRGEIAPYRDFRRTETWILMGQRHALPEARAPRAILGILQDTYRRFAVYAAALSATCWLLMFLAMALQPPGAPWTFTYRE